MCALVLSCIWNGCVKGLIHVSFFRTRYAPAPCLACVHTCNPIMLRKSTQPFLIMPIHFSVDVFDGKHSKPHQSIVCWKHQLVLWYTHTHTHSSYCRQLVLTCWVTQIRWLVVEWRKYEGKGREGEGGREGERKREREREYYGVHVHTC